MGEEGRSTKRLKARGDHWNSAVPPYSKSTFDGKQITGSSRSLRTIGLDLGKPLRTDHNDLLSRDTISIEILYRLY